MKDPPPTHWYDRLLVASLCAGGVVAVAYIALISAGNATLPGPLNALLFLTIAVAIVCLMAKVLAEQILARIDEMESNLMRQIDLLVGARRDDAATLDLSRQRVVASVPMAVGLDSQVLQFGDRISRRLQQRED